MSEQLPAVSIEVAEFWAANGARVERERILNILERRALDLEACGKQDDCKEMAMIVRVCMSDIREVSNE